MRIFLIITMVIFFSSPLWAADSDTPAPATTPAASKVIDDNAVPPVPTAKASLSDLRSQQIETDDEDAAAHENSANPDADTDPDACTARDVSETMQIPENLRDFSSGQGSGGNNSKTTIHGIGYTLSGDSSEKPVNKYAVCKASYDKMTNACYKDMPCSGCEAAVKQFSTACGYVGRDESIEAEPMGVGHGGGRTMDGRRNVPVNKLPQR